MSRYPQACSRWVLTFLLLCFLSRSHADETLLACSDTAEWPPYSFRDDNQSGQVVGISVDLLDAIFSRAGYSWRMELLPWKRCLHYVAKGQYQVVTDASSNPQREKDYLISDPAYSLSQALFFDRRRFAEGAPALHEQTVAEYRFGGLAGYNYDVYEFDGVVIDTSVDSYADLIELVRRGRLDFAIGIPEVMAGLVHSGKLDLTEIGQVPIPGAEPLRFHYLLPRNAQGIALRKIINRELAALKADGCYQQIMARYGVGR